MAALKVYSLFGVVHELSFQEATAGVLYMHEPEGIAQVVAAGTEDRGSLRSE